MLDDEESEKERFREFPGKLTRKKKEEKRRADEKR